jgi:hypothetical protein
MSNYCPPNQTEHRIQKWTPTGRYRPVTGKFLGIGVYGQSVATRAWLHTFKGFSYVPGNVDELPIFETYGVQSSALYVGLSPRTDLAEYIQRNANAGIKKFNIDEPYDSHVKPDATGGYGAQFVITTSDIVQQNNSTLFFSDYYHDSCVSGGHNTISWVIETAKNASPAVRAGTHSKWQYVFGVRTTDPRDQWTRLHNELASLGRFNHSWIQMTYHSNYFTEWTPQEELQLQFGHANSLGSVNTVFTWAMRGSEFSISRVDFFLEIARLHGWVQREEMLIEEIWCCPPNIIEPTVEDCTLAATLDLGQRRWV